MKLTSVGFIKALTLLDLDFEIKTKIQNCIYKKNITFTVRNFKLNHNNIYYRAIYIRNIVSDAAYRGLCFHLIVRRSNDTIGHKLLHISDIIDVRSSNG